MLLRLEQKTGLTPDMCEDSTCCSVQLQAGVVLNLWRDWLLFIIRTRGISQALACAMALQVKAAQDQLDLMLQLLTFFFFSKSRLHVKLLRVGISSSFLPQDCLNNRSFIIINCTLAISMLYFTCKLPCNFNTLIKMDSSGKVTENFLIKLIFF